MTDKDRRTGERVEAIVVLQLDEQGRYGVTRDVSDKGLLIATREELRAGDRLDVVVYVKDQSLKRVARVVRVEKSPPSEEWPFRVAMELDGPLPSVVIEEGTRAAATFRRPE
jgi:hypothetical protein